MRNNANSGSLSVSLDTAFVSSAVFDGSNMFITRNGTAGTTTASTGNFNISKYFIGSAPTVGGYWYGNISEIIIYNRNLTTTERQKIEGYLAWKWGLQASLDVAHL